MTSIKYDVPAAPLDVHQRGYNRTGSSGFMRQSLHQPNTLARRDEGSRERELMAVIAGLVRELHPGRSQIHRNFAVEPA